MGNLLNSLDWPTIIALITLFGGDKIWSAYKNRKTDQRKAEASAKTEEISARSMEFELYKKQIEDLQTRLDKRDQKVDFLYGELRDKENTILRMTAEANINDLKLVNAEDWRCNILDCQRRHPPKDYKRLNDITYKPKE